MLRILRAVAAAAAVSTVAAVVAFAMAGTAPALATNSPAASGWTTYHGSNARTGSFPERAVKRLAADWTSAALDGAIYAEPLWQGNRVYVATENDSVYALSRTTGRVIWRHHLGTPVPLSALPCGDINPLGITSTPVVVGSLLYVSAERVPLQHRLFALSLRTGDVVASWSLDLHLPGSDPSAQQQRAALTYYDGTVYVPFGGLWGDCAQYVGQVVGIRPGRAPIAYRVPTSREGAIWGTSGLAVGADGDLYAATGNSASNSGWDGGDSVLRLSPSLRLLGYFAPTDFVHLNQADLDLGSTGPLPLPGGRLFEIGKQGVGFLLSALHLGGVGHPLASGPVCDGAYGADAYGDGLVFVPCTNALVAIRVTRSGFHVAWQSSGWDAGPPVVGGGAVFSVNEGNATLQVLSAATGRPIAQESLSTVEHFDPPSLAPGQVIVPAGNRVLAYRLES